MPTNRANPRKQQALEALQKGLGENKLILGDGVLSLEDVLNDPKVYKALSGAINVGSLGREETQDILDYSYTVEGRLAALGVQDPLEGLEAQKAIWQAVMKKQVKSFFDAVQDQIIGLKIVEPRTVDIFLSTNLKAIAPLLQSPGVASLFSEKLKAMAGANASGSTAKQIYQKLRAKQQAVVWLHTYPTIPRWMPFPNTVGERKQQGLDAKWLKENVWPELRSLGHDVQEVVQTMQTSLNLQTFDNPGVPATNREALSVLTKLSDKQGAKDAFEKHEVDVERQIAIAQLAALVTLFVVLIHALHTGVDTEA